MSIDKIETGDELSHSGDQFRRNIEKLKELFPQVIAEDKIDFEVLKQLLGGEVENGEEYFRFSWAGKSRARLEAHKPSTGTLRPVVDESVNWDKTKNLYIEGDNLEVLKLLQKGYGNKVKMIYIDPPYNTGKDFVYKDNYKDNIKHYQGLTGLIDSSGNRVSSNSNTDGRFHSNWLNMMYPRLKLARNLLSDSGVIFVSIDDHEACNLKKMMDEVFGEKCFISDITVVNNLKGRNDKKYIATANERLLMYVKSDEFQEYGLSLPDDKVASYKLEDERGKYRLIELRKRGGPDTREERPNMFFAFYANPDNGAVKLEQDELHNTQVIPMKSNGVEGRWRWGKETASLRLNSLVAQSVQGTDRYNIYEKDYLVQEGTLRRIKPKSVMSGAAYSTDGATKHYRSIMGDIEFTNPKPVAFISDLIEYSAPPESSPIILDFFSGSSSSAHAVLELNAKDGGNRRFIQVQLPEPTKEESVAYQKGFMTISDIGKERIRRVLQEIKSRKGDSSKNTDLGFKVFRLDSSNIVPWGGAQEDLDKELFDVADNIVSDRTSEDILSEILLKYGLDLSSPIEHKSTTKHNIYNVGIGALFVCMDGSIHESVAEEIGEWKNELKPETCRVVFRDSGLTDVSKTNIYQTLKRYGISEVRSI